MCTAPPDCSCEVGSQHPAEWQGPDCRLTSLVLRCDSQGHHEAAVSYFQKLLDRQPNHYTVLVQLLGMLRRAGKLKEADKYLAAAEAATAGGTLGGAKPAPAGGAGGGSSSAVAVDGGLSYCKGLLHK